MGSDKCSCGWIVKWKGREGRGGCEEVRKATAKSPGTLVMLIHLELSLQTVGEGTAVGH